jgi:SAM-dependent methyltransferase
MTREFTNSRQARGHDHGTADCRVCGSIGPVKWYEVREMMMGTREVFDYFQCEGCHSLQIARVPDDISAYYAAGEYYSFIAPSPASLKVVSPLLSLAARLSYRSQAWPARFMSAWFLNIEGISSIGRLGPALHSRILDVGCGGGLLLTALKLLGFRNLLGIDKYLPTAARTDGIDLRRLTIDSLPSDAMFDLIMFHHSFEHLENPLQSLRQALSHLSSNGTILIRMPVVAWAFAEYGPNWFQIDAPRHVCIHSVKSVKTMVRRCGAAVSDYYFDSTDAQFLWSQAYASGIEMHQTHSNFVQKEAVGALRRVLSRHGRDLSRKAHLLNSSEVGDQATFYLRASLPVRNPQLDSANSLLLS